MQKKFMYYNEGEVLEKRKILDKKRLLVE